MARFIWSEHNIFQFNIAMDDTKFVDFDEGQENVLGSDLDPLEGNSLKIGCNLLYKKILTYISIIENLHDYAYVSLP